MRIIKFRAYHKEQGCMYFTQSSLGTDGDGWIDSIDFERKKIELGCESDNGEDYIDWFSFDDIEIMQFTGLLDKNGKEIYERDIISHDCHPGEHKPDVDSVFWSDGHWGFEEEAHSGDGYILTKDAGEISEVIGNIYENPELLTPQKE